MTCTRSTPVLEVTMTGFLKTNGCFYNDILLQNDLLILDING